VFTSEGGGRVAAARLPVFGADRVSRLLLGLARKWPASTSGRRAQVNGLPGAVLFPAPGECQTLALRIEQGRIREIYSVRNPDKLRHVSELAARSESD
jgi:RNA polymerase sigma-70 factor (ECF subfamily)